MSQPQLPLSLDRDSEEPIYRQLIRQIRMQIESGNLPSGTRLPASRDLATQIGISRISVVNAYADLRAQGYLSAHAGRGTFVAKDISPAARTAQRTSLPITEENPSTHDYSMRDMMRLARRKGVINFSHGAPPREFFPMKHLRDAINTVLERDGSAALTYEEAEGYAPLRYTVRDYVSALGIQTSADNVLITGGAQQGLDLVVQALVAEGEVIVTTNPTYLGIIDIARTRRIHLHSIASDDDGMRIDLLEEYLLENKPSLIYVQPTFENPTGRVMPMHRRRQLLNLAHTYNVPIVEDGVYHEFRFEGESLPPLKSLDEHNDVIHISAYTKMLLPGMRIGYLIAGGAHYERLVRVKQAADISTPSLNQRAIHMLIQRGVLAQHLQRNNRELARRRDAALHAAENYFPEESIWRTPEGGLYLWVRLPKPGPTSAQLFISAVQRNVAFAIGTVFYTNACGNYHMRLNYGMQPPGVIDEGFRRLGEAWHELSHGYREMEGSPFL
jgi:GntR family transcriptional regulator/MocR family aminotransferase